VRAALNAIGLALPWQRIIVNLAPADLPKEGSHYDVPIALGPLAAMGVLPPDEMAGYTAMGELSLDGHITAVAGILPAAIAAASPQANARCPRARAIPGCIPQDAPPAPAVSPCRAAEARPRPTTAAHHRTQRSISCGRPNGSTPSSLMTGVALLNRSMDRSHNLNHESNGGFPLHPSLISFFAVNKTG
jgi:hypothetical protein